MCLTGLMDPDGRKGSLVAVLMVIQWIQPIMSLVSRGGSVLLASLKKVIKLLSISSTLYEGCEYERQKTG